VVVFILLNSHGGAHLVITVVAVILIFLYSWGGDELVNSHGGANIVQ
jgi:hypothetical protein